MLPITTHVGKDNEVLKHTWGKNEYPCEISELSTPVNEGQPVQGEGFTQGEWIGGKKNNFEYIDIDADGERICSVYTGIESNPEAEENAKLICLAPTLLKENEQLKEYANYIGDKIAAGDDEILTFQQWLDNPALSQTETK